jgi:hypothetical protein
MFIVLFSYRYFSQGEVLDRVPSCYLLLGSILTGIQLLCLLSFSYPPSPATTDLDLDLDPVIVQGLCGCKKDLKGDLDRASSDLKLEGSVMVQGQENGSKKKLDNDLELVPVLVQVQGQDQGEGKKFINDDLDLNTPSDLKPEPGLGPNQIDTCSNSSRVETFDVECKDGRCEDDDQDLAVNYTNVDVLKTRALWTLWFADIAINYAFEFIPSFYKVKKQLFFFT